MFYPGIFSIKCLIGSTYFANVDSNSVLRTTLIQQGEAQNEYDHNHEHFEIMTPK
jgi:hypothetical protein